MRYRCVILLGICSAFFSVLVFADSEDTRKPITIEADQAVLDEKKQISTYTGNVVLKQGGIEVKANTITVYSKEGQLQRVIAKGDPVHYRQQQTQDEDIRAVSQRMEYETESKSVLLLGDAELWQGGNRFSGKRIQYDPSEEKVIATGDPGSTANGGQRVQITLQPQSSEQKKQKQPLQKQQQDKP